MQGHENVDVSRQTVSLDSPDGMKTIRYDLLVGADGVRSEVRKVLVKSDRSMKSEYGFVGPLRYVTATHLELPASWHSAEWQKVMQPARERDIQEDPYSMMQCQGKLMQYCLPIYMRATHLCTIPPTFVKTVDSASFVAQMLGFIRVDDATACLVRCQRWLYCGNASSSDMLELTCSANLQVGNLRADFVAISCCRHRLTHIPMRI